MTEKDAKEVLTRTIRDIPDFPKPGILFKDITPVLSDPGAMRMVTEIMGERCRSKMPDKIVGIESRGFIFGSVLAHHLGVGFVPARKKGKLPAETIKAEYELEYGTDILEMHKDSISRGEKILLIDDLLATGGTARAVCEMIQELGGEIVECAFLIELTFLKGRDKLAPHNVFAMIQY